MELLISTLNTMGTLLIAWAALSVHHKVLNDHKISKNVYLRMRVEQFLGVTGMIFIVIGYILNIFY
jgi:hypothetical protein